MWGSRDGCENWHKKWGMDDVGEGSSGGKLEGQSTGVKESWIGEVMMKGILWNK